jgi:hypothetical protein
MNRPENLGSEGIYSCSKKSRYWQFTHHDQHNGDSHEQTHDENDTALTDEQLKGVSGGNSIDKIPNIRTPKFGPAASISQGEVNSDQTDNNLP